MRRKFVAGNWKMNLNLADAGKLIAGLRAGLPANPPVDVAVCPPFVYLSAVAGMLEGPIQLGAQNCYSENSGAFTGEIAPPMLKDIGCEWVIIGHSERRHIMGETGELLRKKTLAALKAGLKVIYCVGELLEERESHQTQAVLDRQITEVLGLEVDLNQVVVAYEPVWAIGTGRTATPQQAQEAHAHIRGRIAKLYNPDSAQRLRIQYGGSVKPANAEELMAQPDVDGALVGGACLKAEDFLGIIKGTMAAAARG